MVLLLVGFEFVEGVKGVDHVQAFVLDTSVDFPPKGAGLPFKQIAVIG